MYKNGYIYTLIDDFLDAGPYETRAFTSFEKEYKEKNNLENPYTKLPKIQKHIIATVFERTSTLTNCSIDALLFLANIAKSLDKNDPLKKSFYNLLLSAGENGNIGGYVGIGIMNYGSLPHETKILNALRHAMQDEKLSTRARDTIKSLLRKHERRNIFPCKNSASSDGDSDSSSNNENSDIEEMKTIDSTTTSSNTELANAYQNAVENVNLLSKLHAKQQQQISQLQAELIKLRTESVSLQTATAFQKNALAERDKIISILQEHVRTLTVANHQLAHGSFYRDQLISNQAKQLTNLRRFSQFAHTPGISVVTFAERPSRSQS